jgi:hypothetical protein
MQKWPFLSAKDKLETMRRIYPNLVYHCQKSTNFGLLGGILLVEFLAYESGDPTGVSASSIVYPPSC